MNIAIIYDSLTGNTKTLAKEIEKACHHEEIIYIGKPKDVQADLYFIGSWTNKGNCSDSIKEYIQTLHHKQIVYFSTCGFGASQEYFNQLKQRFIQLVDPSNTVIDCFICQGKMTESVKQRYLSLLDKDPDNKKLQFAIKNYEHALSHPDNQDLNNLKEFTLKVITIAKKTKQ